MDNNVIHAAIATYSFFKSEVEKLYNKGSRSTINEMDNLLRAIVPFVLDTIEDDIVCGLFKSDAQKLIEGCLTITEAIKTAENNTSVAKQTLYDALQPAMDVCTLAINNEYKTIVVREFVIAKSVVCSKVYDSRWTDERTINELLKIVSNFFTTYNNLIAIKAIHSPFTISDVWDPNGLRNTIKLDGEMMKLLFDLCIKVSENFDDMMVELEPDAKEIKRLAREHFKEYYSDLNGGVIPLPESFLGDSFSCGTQD